MSNAEHAARAAGLHVTDWTPSEGLRVGDYVEVPLRHEGWAWRLWRKYVLRRPDPPRYGYARVTHVYGNCAQYEPPSR